MTVRQTKTMEYRGNSVSPWLFVDVDRGVALAHYHSVITEILPPPFSLAKTSTGPLGT